MRASDSALSPFETKACSLMYPEGNVQDTSSNTSSPRYPAVKLAEDGLASDRSVGVDFHDQQFVGCTDQ